jgi:SAM-dependent methyltransferase
LLSTTYKFTDFKLFKCIGRATIPPTDKSVGILVANFMKILDVGCGLGRWTKRLVKVFLDAEIVAFDHKRRLSKIKGVKYIHGTAENLPFDDNEFDIVIMSRVLPYVNRLEVIPELERVCKEDGIIVYELMHLGYYVSKLFRGKFKRITNILNSMWYLWFETKLFKKADLPDSLLFLNYESGYTWVEQEILKYGVFVHYSLVIFTKDGEIYKPRLHNKIIKLAKEIIDEET